MLPLIMYSDSPRNGRNWVGGGGNRGLLNGSVDPKENYHVSVSSLSGRTLDHHCQENRAQLCGLDG